MPKDKSKPGETTPFGSVLKNSIAKAVELHASGHIPQAQELYQEILAKYPRISYVIQMLGVTHLQLGEWGRAIELIKSAITLEPKQAGYYLNLGIAMKGACRYEEALLAYESAEKIGGRSADISYNRANLFRDLGRTEEAIFQYSEAISLRHDYVDALNNRGNLYRVLGNHADAIVDFEKVLRYRPDFAPAHINMGNVFQDMGELERALECFEIACRLDPENADAIYNKGNLLKLKGRDIDALGCYTEAIRLEPGLKDAYLNLGAVLQNINQLEQASNCYSLAVQLFPDIPGTYINRARVFYKLGRLKEAARDCEVAVGLCPNQSKDCFNLGAAFKELERYREAATWFEAALRLDPKLPYALGELVVTLGYICSWQGWEERLAALREGVRSNLPATVPFYLLAYVDDPALQRRCADLYVQKEWPSLISGPSGTVVKRDRPKLAYFSADFHDHATCHLMAECFELHDRDRFELIAFSFGPDTGDAMRRRVKAAFENFIDVRGLNDAQVVDACREMGIDIAVDLKGYTKDSRTGIFISRCAPIQISWLGYPGTLGGGFMDYIVADPEIISEEDLSFYSEKVIWMPDSYQVNDMHRRISDQVFTREDCGLPEGAFVYCCFNANYKITPDVFDAWMQILKSVSNSVLWLFEGNAVAAENLRREAAARGVDAKRLIFGSHMPPAQHLARLRLANLFLDTWPCNAHTTASDALWASVPVLTLRGKSFASRVASSLLNAVCMRELISTSVQDYVAKAISIGISLEMYTQINKKLNDNRLSTSLFDCRKFTNNLERAYFEVIEHHASRSGTNVGLH